MKISYTRLFNRLFKFTRKICKILKNVLLVQLILKFFKPVIDDPIYSLLFSSTRVCVRGTILS